MNRSWIDSPLGKLQLVAERATLIGVYFPDHRPAPDLSPDLADGSSDAVFDHAHRALDEYFAGRRTSFEDVVAEPIGGTAFQRRVWKELRAIRFGETISYGELARRIGSPSSARAVGAANAHNPLSIIVPCHRVIGQSGDLTGYAGGQPAKRWLLQHEGLSLSVPPLRFGEGARG